MTDEHRISTSLFSKHINCDDRLHQSFHLAQFSPLKFFLFFFYFSFFFILDRVQQIRIFNPIFKWLKSILSIDVDIKPLVCLFACFGPFSNKFYQLYLVVWSIFDFIFQFFVVFSLPAPFYANNWRKSKYDVISIGSC